ncbi:hypothetical protein AVEN_68042-1 [Araneus ventricosus]|uniref:CCHC-type domain-containing protein n=1 Tax=Araneus ventricosus TaxID=182803 RepID=A0A4Y2MAG6_ARAVE|nr:hypothetical protein AVEN_68042-1 [Araneus ventricosus]
MGRRKVYPLSRHSSEISFYSFFILKRCSDKETFHNASPFVIAKALSASVGEVKTTHKLRSGYLLVEVSSPKQAKQIIKLKSLSNLPISVQPHGTLNSSKGVISVGELFNDTVEHILEELRPQSVKQVQRISIRRDGKLIPTKHLILTFSKPKLPQHIMTGYIRCPVRPCNLNPLRCYKCQRFGHSKPN